MAKTLINWCVNPDGSRGESWNPVRPKGGGWGCTKIRAGCQNCYAERQNKRFGNKRPFTDAEWHFECDRKTLHQPLHWRKPRTVFCMSMGDMFHDDVPFRLVEDVFRVMADAGRRHTYIILTKRPVRMAKTLRDLSALHPRLRLWMSGCFYVGASVSTQEDIDECMPILADLATAGWKTVLSAEPLLEQICWPPEYHLLSQIIVGCETGAKRRAFDNNWAKSMVRTAQFFDIPCFVKQIVIAGTVVTDPSEFPEGLAVQQLAWKRNRTTHRSVRQGSGNRRVGTAHHAPGKEAAHPCPGS